MYPVLIGLLIFSVPVYLFVRGAAAYEREAVEEDEALMGAWS